MEKMCKKCGIVKDVSEFYSCEKCKDGFRNECKVCKNERMKEWSEKNPEYHQNWAENNKEYDKERKKRHYELNKSKYIQRSTDYRKDNKDKVNQWVSDYRKRRFSEDEVYKMTFTARKRIREILKLKGEIKKDSTFDIIGCTPQELVNHIESKFTDNMTWGNYGEWHIDHIIPLASAKNISEIKKLCHYTNLQPLWAKDNLSKGSKMV